MNPATTDDAAIEAALLRLLADRGERRSLDPAEVARAIGGPHPDGWGPLMGAVRRVASRLAREGRVVILRKGRPVDPDALRGVYRLTIGAGSSAEVRPVSR